MKNKHAGFTLIELLIVISIIAILAVNAIPAYSQYLQKARRADAHTALLSLQFAQEKFRVNCPSYATTIGDAIDCNTSTLKATNKSEVHTTDTGDEKWHYDLTISGVTPDIYTLTATAATGSPQTNDTSCSTIKIDQESTKPPTDCW
jgi:type IV pilus assembly protein PilE